MCPDKLTNRASDQPLQETYEEAWLVQDEGIVSLPSPSVPIEPVSSDPDINGQNAPAKLIIKTENPWDSAQTVFKTDQLLKLKVTGYNKGGLLVNWKGLQGFVPASQLIDFPQFHLETERVEALKAWVNRTITLKIIELIPKNNRLILSERASQVKSEQRERIFGHLCPGDQLEGQVTNLTNFGAFVDIGGVEGLIHISELSWGRVTHPSQIVQPGQSISVLVMKVDRRLDRVALSLKRLKPDPWHGVEKRYYPGQIVQGEVSNIASFGAFVQLENELEGLIHVSELADSPFYHPRDIVRRGQVVVARVLAVDGKAKRLSLSMRQDKNG